MVSYTNKHLLPDALFQALTRDEYKRKGDYSASMLASPIQKVILEERHKDEIVIDASDNFWLFIGQAIHYYLTKHDTEGAIKEEELAVEIPIGDKTVTLSGTTDIYNKDIDDYKVTKAWVSIYGIRPEWVAQMNVYAFLWESHGFRVNNLNVMAILRDWDKNKVKQYKDYPKIPFLRMPIVSWTPTLRMNYIKGRIQAFEMAKQLADNMLPACTDEERWQNKTTYAVMKEGRKTAVRVFDTRDDADKCCKELSEEKINRYRNLWVLERKGAYARCNEYCNASPFCHQLVREKEGVIYDEQS